MLAHELPIFITTNHLIMCESNSVLFADFIEYFPVMNNCQWQGQVEYLICTQQNRWRHKLQITLFKSWGLRSAQRGTLLGHEDRGNSDFLGSNSFVSYDLYTICFTVTSHQWLVAFRSFTLRIGPLEHKVCWRVLKEKGTRWWSSRHRILNMAGIPQKSHRIYEYSLNWLHLWKKVCAWRKEATVKLFARDIYRCTYGHG